MVESEYNTKGWNWGQYELGEKSMRFKVEGQSCIDIPYNEMANVSLPIKNEVSVEFAQDDTAKDV